METHGLKIRPMSAFTLFAMLGCGGAIVADDNSIDGAADAIGGDASQKAGKDSAPGDATTLDGDAADGGDAALGVPTSVASPGTPPFWLTVDTTNVYWTNTDGTVMKCPVGGCGALPA